MKKRRNQEERLKEKKRNREDKKTKKKRDREFKTKENQTKVKSMTVWIEPMFRAGQSTQDLPSTAGAIPYSY